MTTNKSDDLSNLSQPMRAQVRLELPKSAYTDDDGDGMPILNGSGRERRMVQAYRPLTIHEDETVLDCCTHAHEIARAHGAREVMLEHLIHALARVPEAISILEERGFQVEPLRRESAAIIAGEIPVDQPSNNSAIRASKDFNTVMHLAAAKASAHDERSMGVRELLDALLGYDPKSRAVRLLKKYRSGAGAEETPDPLQEVRGTLDRYATEVRELRLSVVDLKDAQRASNGDTKLNAIEQKLATVLAEVVSDRSANSDRARGIQDWVAAQRSDMASLQRVIGDRMALVEKAMQSQNGGAHAGQTHTLINDRFLSLQKSHEMSRGDVLRVEASVSDRMKAMERLVENHTSMIASGDGGGGNPVDLRALVERLASLENVIEGKQFDGRGLEAAMTEKLATLSRTLEGQAGGSSRSWTAMSDRLFALERAVGAQRAETQGIQQLVASEIKMLEKAINEANEHRVNGASALFADPDLGDRFASLEKSIDAMRTQHPADGQVGERLRVFERLLESNLGTSSKSFNSLGDRLQVLEKSMTMQRTDVVSINNALDDELEQVRKALVALGHAQQTLSQAIDEWRLNNSGDLSIISNRLAALERTPVYAPISVQPAIAQPLQQAASQLIGDKANSVRARLGIPTT